MIPQIQAQLFLDENRTIRETATCRKRISLHDDNIVQADAGYYSALNGLQELMLAGGATETLSLNPAFTYILLPTAGAVNCITLVDQRVLTAGQAGMVSNKSVGELALQNPFSDNLVSLLIITVLNDRRLDLASIHTYEEVSKQVNQLVPVFTVAGQYNKHIAAMNLGFFNGRGESRYIPVRCHSSVTTVFVIRGAFEVEGRLLHEGDTLGTWHAPELEIEALSNGAILLIMETDLIKFNPAGYLY